MGRFETDRLIERLFINNCHHFVHPDGGVALRREPVDAFPNQCQRRTKVVIVIIISIILPVLGTFFARLASPPSTYCSGRTRLSFENDETSPSSSTFLSRCPSNVMKKDKMPITAHSVHRRLRIASEDTAGNGVGTMAPTCPETVPSDL
uniref:Uncharacterized protein n=1 Tax=Anopheles culicifacies TaxID=139723 RepID=A0A182MQJ9_9DIPT